MILTLNHTSKQAQLLLQMIDLLQRKDIQFSKKIETFNELPSTKLSFISVLKHINYETTMTRHNHKFLVFILVE